MALSEELKKVYSSNPVGQRYYDTVEVSHSQFTQTYYLVKDSVSHVWNTETLTGITFIPYGFDIKLPEVGSAQQDLTFVFDNVGREITDEIELATNLITEPIKVKYRTYVDGFSDPQMDVLELSLTNISVDNYSVSAVATRPDLYKRIIPSGNKAFFDSRFKGLYV